MFIRTGEPGAADPAHDAIQRRRKAFEASPKSDVVLEFAVHRDERRFHKSRHIHGVEILLSIDSPHLVSVNPLERYLAMILGKGTHLASNWRKKKARFYSPSLASFWQKKAVSCPTVSGIPRMNPELAWMVAIFWIGGKPGGEVSMAPASRLSERR